MSENEQITEALISRFLDGEISPSEKQILDEQISSDPQAAELFEQLKELHEQTKLDINRQADQGRPPQEIFENAWKQRRPLIIRLPGISPLLRFTVGLAAGLVIGIAAGLGLSTRNNPQQIPGPVSLSDSTPTENVQTAMTASSPNQRTIRNVDLYGFTDNSGNKWLVEGLQESSLKPTIKFSDL